MDISNNDHFPYEIRDVEPKQNAELAKYFAGKLTGSVRVAPKGYFFPQKYKEEALNIFTLPIRPGDIFIASYPRSGFVSLETLRFSIFVNPELTKKLPEENSQSNEKLQLLKWVTQRGTEQVAAAPSPRFIKTHMPMSLLPPTLLEKGKMVYVARDPRDVVVSYYHMGRQTRTQGYTGDFKTYWDFFRYDLIHWTPFFEHLKEAWEQRHHPNMLFLFFEELTKDLPASVRRVASFFGKSFSEEEIQKLCVHLSIASFESNKSVNFDVMAGLGLLIAGEQTFIRKGKSGGWRDYFDEEMAKQAEDWIADNLRDTDFRYPHLDRGTGQ